ncbi:hypothetical protein VHUM_00305 [Vanrija humicola]|uniref:G-patch domain-containing protein n=1 Tax=Vanrija humicola TaxID=5417 RepID=A0A7D8Z747_VANHU|nr:hypothetical protein VHUM_00305 [Vanrija humicola]
MSDSEDDFMSDKFLVEAPTTSKTYTQRRSAAALKAERKVRADNAAPRRQVEAERRHAGLNTSLFDAPAEGSGSGQAKAVGLMMKMGWKVGEGLGRRRSASPEGPEGSRGAAGGGGAYDDDAPRGGIAARAEPIRISMWAGRKGLSARSPSPPPLDPRRNNPDYLPPERHAALAADGEVFRGRRGEDAAAKKAERDAGKARALLQELDEAKGVKFHPLWAQPANPAALPRPLLRLLYPDDVTPSRSPSPELEEVALPAPVATTRAKNMSAAERLRAQMRRDMLSELGGSDDGDVKFGVPRAAEEDEAKPAPADTDDKTDWASLVSGTKRVLSLSPAEHLAFLVSQLRTEHLFCFWCGSRYASFEEMDGPGGCPGEDEDDH